ncbi:hypothetical protein [Sulfuricurvum sp.]|uniref:hypothetical protein n=1 Tax=Sulfuricurvum sp. TaxID=2025608 RepID=UPI003BB4CABB
MKKSFTALVASAVMCSVAFASPTANELSFTGLNATEHAALFGDGLTTQAVALDGAEMKATEGEILWLPIAVGVGVMSRWQYLNAPTLNGRVYQRNIRFSRRR